MNARKSAAAPVRRGLRDLTYKAGSVLALGAIGYLGETGSDGGLLKDIWTAAKTASPFAAMFATLAWIDERRERREAQQQCNERTIDYVESTNLAVRTFDGALARMQAAAEQLRRRRRARGRR